MDRRGFFWTLIACVVGTFTPKQLTIGRMPNNAKVHFRNSRELDYKISEWNRVKSKG